MVRERQIQHTAIAASGGPPKRFSGRALQGVYFSIVAKALHKARIIDDEEGIDLAKTFLEKFENETA